MIDAEEFDVAFQLTNEELEFCDAMVTQYGTNVDPQSVADVTFPEEEDD